MSLDTKVAVGDALAAHATIAALLARRHDDASAPAIYLGNLAAATIAVGTGEERMPYPCITYRVQGHGENLAFVPTRAEIAAGSASGVAPFADETLYLEIWDQSPDDAARERLADAVRDALKTRRLTLSEHSPATTPTGGAIYDIRLVADNRDQYDNTRNAWFCAMQFRLFTARPDA